MLNFFATKGMMVDKVHDINSFKPSECLEKYISNNTRQRTQPPKDSEKDF